ncbi:MAG: hypothetical protein KAH84_07895 [Thiomargarita sp.]|nr:hypothetical protein [Thiomargarita sp.]
MLDDVVVPGKELTDATELPSVLNDLQAKALQQQIERIIQSKMELALKRLVKETTHEIKVYLDKKLPDLLEN